MERKLKLLVAQQTNNVTNSFNEHTLKLAQSIKTILTNIAQRNAAGAPRRQRAAMHSDPPLLADHNNNNDANNNNNNNGDDDNNDHRLLDTCHGLDWPHSFIQLLDALAMQQQQLATGNLHPPAPRPPSISTVSSLAIDDRDFELVALPSDGAFGSPIATNGANKRAHLDEKCSIWLMDFAGLPNGHDGALPPPPTNEHTNVDVQYDTQYAQPEHQHDRNIINLMKFLCKKSSSSSNLRLNQQLAPATNTGAAANQLKRSNTLPFRFNQITLIDLNQFKRQDFDEDEDTGDECQRPPMGTSSQRAREPAPTLGGAHQDQGSAADARTLQPPQTPVAHKQQPAPARPGQSDAAGQGHSASAKDDGKYSMLQFALYNFREAIEKYSLESRANKFKNKPGSPSQQVRHACEPDDHHQVGDTSTLRGSLKLIESLRNGNTSLAGAGEQAPTGAAKLASNNNNNGQWTWAELAQMVKFTTTPIKRPLLKLANSNDDLDRRAVDCFAAIMQYMGDLPSAGSSNKHNHHQMLGGEFECVYLILINCHNYPVLRDEIYCQLIKQTTNNRSLKTDSCLRGWRLFSLVAAYFDCSPTFRPYLVKYLETAAYDKRRAYHSIASLCLQNLRKTFKYKGRKNVPSIEEIAATSAGRNSKRQIYRLPGGTERVINTKSTTVVDDIIHEICSNMLSVTDPDEMLEYSLYCIADGDLYTMPLNRDEYILDITTELIKNHQQYFLIFCRSIWHYPLRMDSQLYIEVIFNQIAPDYLEGLFLVLPALSPNHLASTSSPSSSSSSSRPPASGRSSAPISHSSPSADLLHHQNHKHPLRLKSKLVKEIARIAALLHRASGTDYIPHKDEIKYLLPKPIASAIKQQQRASNSSNDPIHQLQSSSSSGSSAGSTKNHQTEDYQHQHQSSTDTLIMSPQKWIELVQENCREMSAFDALDAKAQFLDIVRHWPLFGSSFFAIKLIQRDLIHPMDFILALNKLGIQMLDPITHETVHKYPFNEVVSTRKVRSEDGTLFLDMKCGNLMKRTIIRIQTDQAHEISRLIRQYIDIEMLQTNKIQQQRQQQQTGIVYSSSQMQQRTFFSSQNDEPTDASEQNE